jgi:hypothetical protein
MMNEENTSPDNAMLKANDQKKDHEGLETTNP